MQNAHVYGPNFLDESNRSIFKIARSPLHGAGGHIDQGQGGVHHHYDLQGGGIVSKNS
jgi:hypothetical protein